MSPSALFVTTVPITLEAFLLPFADHFRSAGWRVDALANGATLNPHIAEHFDARFDAAWNRNPLDPRNLVGTPRQVREIVERERYDLVHVHTPIAAFVTRFALRRISHSMRPVVIYTAHGFHFYEGQSTLPHAVYRAMEKMAGRWTDYLATINREDLIAARNLGTIPTARIRLIPGIGVDTAAYSPHATTPSERAETRISLNVADDDFMLTMVAELAAVKRHTHLFKALSKTADNSVVVVLVGDGPLESQLRKTAARLGVSSRVRWAGYRRDVPAILRSSDAAVLASEREGLPRSVLEAMACGIPVIGTQTRGISDAVGSVAGWIVPKEDAAALARAIDHAAVRRDEVKARGFAARERAIAEYSLSRIIDAYEDLYREALA